MGRNNIIIFGLLLSVIISAITFSPEIQKILSDTVSDIISELSIFTEEPGGNSLGNQPEGGDKKVCGTCHSDKGADFKKRYQHAPFIKWQCTDCHVPHTLGTGKYEFVVQIDKLCASCHYDRKGEMNMPVQHVPFGKGRCTDCHDPHASDVPKMLRVEQKMLCQSCHTMSMKFSGLPYQHAPFEKGFCSDCHAPHASVGKALTLLPGDKLCYSCHYDRLAEKNMPVLHKPFGEGNCTGCHGAHATSGEKMLILPKDKLCFYCHVDKVKESKVGYQHKPFVEGKCSDCHVAHGSQNESLTLRPRTELCYMCHPQYRKVFTAPSKHPVGNGLLECYGCHDPHAGPGQKMTRAKGNQLCYICHQGLENSYEQLAHATKADGKGGKGACTNCHVPHGAPVKPLLPGNQLVVCGECHGKVTKARITHPVGGNSQDVWHGGVLWCTGCHGPHGTPNKKFTLLPGDGLCLKCHGEKIKGGENYTVHRLIPNQNEHKKKEVTTKVVPRQKEPYRIVR